MRYLIQLLLLAGCSSSPPPEPKPHKQEPVVGEFKSMTYPINEAEHVTVFDLPDRYNPVRCWAFVNVKTGTSHMRCDDYAPISGQPDAGGTLER